MTIKWNLIVLTLILVLVSPITNAENNSSTKYKFAQANQLGAKENPLSVTVISAEKSNQEILDEKEDRVERYKNDIWLIRVGFSQGILFLFQLIVFGVQAYKLHQTIIETKNSSKIQLRAYISVVPDLPIPFIVNEKVTIPIIITNDGQTPAHNLFHVSGINIFPYPFPQNFIKTESGKNMIKRYSSSSKSYIAKGGKINLYKESIIILSNDDIDKIKNQKDYRLYVNGTVFYQDVFKDWHRTEFCFLYQKDSAGFSWSYDPLHNVAT